MIRIRQDIEAQARGMLKTYGIRLGTVTLSRNRAGFRDRLPDRGSRCGLCGGRRDRRRAPGRLSLHHVLKKRDSPADRDDNAL